MSPIATLIPVANDESRVYRLCSHGDPQLVRQSATQPMKSEPLHAGNNLNRILSPTHILITGNFDHLAEETVDRLLSTLLVVLPFSSSTNQYSNVPRSS